jgi:hypothetical protein
MEGFFAFGGNTELARVFPPKAKKTKRTAIGFACEALFESLDQREAF